MKIAGLLGYNDVILNSLSHDFFNVNDFRKMNEKQIETMVAELTEKAKIKKLIDC